MRQQAALEGFRRGSKVAFAELAEHTVRHLRSVAEHKLGSPDDANDVLALSLFVAWDRRAKFQGDLWGLCGMGWHPDGQPDPQLEAGDRPPQAARGVGPGRTRGACRDDPDGGEAHPRAVPSVAVRRDPEAA